jgi:hypothetical protein
MENSVAIESDPSRYPAAAVVAVVVIVPASLAFAGYAIWSGVRYLTVRRLRVDAASSLWHLIVLSAAAGLLSFAIVEFAKRQSPMRRLFNTGAAQSEFGGALSSVLGLPFGTDSPISYSGTIRQVAAQISVQLRRLVQLSADQNSPPERRREALGLALGVGISPEAQLPAQGDSPQGAELGAIYDLIDRRLDVFQIDATQRWCTLLRSLAAVTAGLLSALSASAISAPINTIIIATIAGVVVGGPVSWIARDLTRIVERKARF